MKTLNLRAAKVSRFTVCTVDTASAYSGLASTVYLHALFLKYMYAYLVLELSVA